MAVGSAALFGFLAGCASPRESRIQAASALFNTLDARAQSLIREGLVQEGFTREMVILALGQPTKVSVTETPQGTLETLAYRNFLYSSESAQKLAFDPPTLRSASGPMVSSSAPGGPSLTSTQGSRTQSTLTDGSDTPLATLHLELQGGRVTRVQLEP